MRLKQIQWKRGSNELGSLDLMTAVAKKLSLEQGAEVMIIIRFPDWGQPHVVTSTPEQLPSHNRAWNAKAIIRLMELFRKWPGLESIKAYLDGKGEKGAVPDI